MARLRRKAEKFVAYRLALEAEFPLPYPATVRVRPLKKYDTRSVGIAGGQLRWGNRIFIDVDERLAFWQQVETLNHEWAHARCALRHNLEQLRIVEGNEHDDEYWLEYGRIYRWAYDRDGLEDALTR